MLRPWHLQIVIDRDGPTPAYLQIAHALIEAIRRGRLASGSALPGTRNLAARLHVNRKTVEQAYDEMVAQGWLTAEPTRGTFVSAFLPDDRPRGAADRPPAGRAGAGIHAAPRCPRSAVDAAGTGPAGFR